MNRSVSPELYPTIEWWIPGDTPLHFASCSTNIDAANKLIDYGAVVSCPGAAGMTPLHWAAYFGRTAGSSNPAHRTWSKPDCTGRTSMHSVPHCMWSRAFRFTEQTVPPDFAKHSLSIAGKSALHLAASHADPSLFIRLIEDGFDPYQ